MILKTNYPWYISSYLLFTLKCDDRRIHLKLRQVDIFAYLLLRLHNADKSSQ